MLVNNNSRIILYSLFDNILTHTLLLDVNGVNLPYQLHTYFVDESATP